MGTSARRYQGATHGNQPSATPPWSHIVLASTARAKELQSRESFGSFELHPPRHGEPRLERVGSMMDAANFVRHERSALLDDKERERVERGLDGVVRAHLRHGHGLARKAKRPLLGQGPSAEG